MTQAVDVYNRLMVDMCRESNTIGTKYSKNTDEWNLRDMVSEVAYTLDIYLDEKSIYYFDAHNPKDRRRDHYPRIYKALVRRMTRFIKKYMNEALEMDSAVYHCSCFD